ncbi:MAG: hypothetical protein QW745_07640 [Thermoplasmata archaeon]
MFIVINNDNVTIRKNLKQINKKLKSEFKKEDFKNLNNNYIMNVTNEDLDFKRDVHELSRVFVQKLYKKDAGNLINYAFFAIMLIMLLITMTSVSGMSGKIVELATQLQKLSLGAGL